MFFKKDETINGLVTVVATMVNQIQDLFNSIDRINNEYDDLRIIVENIENNTLKKNYITERDLEQYIENDSDIVFTDSISDYGFIDEEILKNSVDNLVNRDDLDQIIETHIMKIENFIEDSIYEHLNNLSFSNLFKLYILKKLNIK